LCEGLKRHEKPEAQKDFSKQFGRVWILGMLFVTGWTTEAGLIINGSFESGAFSANQGPGVMELDGGSTAIQGWIVQGGLTGQGVPVGIAWESNDNTSGFKAADGDYFLNLAGSDGSSHRGGITLAQDIITVPGQWYTLSFAMGSCSAADGDSINPVVKVTVNGSCGACCFAGDNSVPSSGGVKSYWQNESLTFQASSATTFITFNASTSLRAADSFIGLDNVGLVPVPESTTAVAGFGALGLAMAAMRFNSRGRK
jgi:hypothetical protein